MVAELRELARPIMSRGAGLHADEARRQCFEERQHLATPESLPDNGRLVGVDAVDLKHVLGDIQPDRGNLHLHGSPHVIRFRRSTLWHIDAGSGRRLPHQNLTTRSAPACLFPPAADMPAHWLWAGMCQEPTLARGLVKHLIRAHEQRLWQINSDSLCGSGVDRQFEFRWLLDWHVGRLSALQKIGRDGAGLPPQLD